MTCLFCGKESVFTSYVPFERTELRAMLASTGKAFSVGGANVKVWYERITVQHQDGSTCVREEERK